LRKNCCQFQTQVYELMPEEEPFYLNMNASADLPPKAKFRAEMADRNDIGAVFLRGVKVGRVTPCAPLRVWPSPARTE
jgi:hypothetical protein